MGRNIIIRLTMKRTLLLVFTLLPLALSAQSFFVKAGLGLATQTGAVGVHSGSRIGFGYEHELSQTIGFAPTLSVVGRGWKVRDVDTPDLLFDDAGHMLDAFGNITDDPTLQAQRPVLDADGEVVPGEFMRSMMHRTYSANYLQLDAPFNFYRRVGMAEYVTFTVGPWAAVGIAGKRRTEGDGRVSPDRKSNYTDRIFSLPGAHPFDCGLKAGVGYQFPSSLTVNLEGEFGFLKTNSITGAGVLDDPFAHHAGRNVSVTLTLSYRLNKTIWRSED